ncbi:MAG: hypothetical protein NTX61_14570, partial [Bacteroidetes bacterium]|nr:hypothetical protein [Bacteroidota bacterium]
MKILYWFSGSKWPRKHLVFPLFLFFIFSGINLESRGQCANYIWANCNPIDIQPPPPGQCDSSSYINPCNGDSAELIAVPGTAGIIHDWYIVGGGMLTSHKDTLYVKVPGKYYHKIDGCSVYSDTIMVGLLPRPTLYITTNKPGNEVCVGEPICLTATYFPSSSTFMWLSTIPGMGAPNPACVQIGVAGITLVTGLAIHPNGCSQISVKNIIVDAPVNPGIISPPDTVCSGTAPSPMTGTPPTGGGGGYQYSWQSSSVDQSSFTNITGATNLGYSPGNLTVTTYYRRFVSANHCFPNVSNVIEILVNPSPVVITGSTHDTICSGSSVNHSIVSNDDQATYQWTATVPSAPSVPVNGVVSPGSGTTITDNLSMNFGINTPGTVVYSITPTGRGSTFCPGVPRNLTVTVEPIPVITNNFTVDSVCSGAPVGPIPLTSNVTGTYFNYWLEYNPNYIVNISPPILSDNHVTSIPLYHFTNIALVTKDVVIHITPVGPGPAPNGCSGPEVTDIVPVKPSPTVTNSPMYQRQCSGNPTDTVVLQGNYPGTTFTWALISDGGCTGFNPGPGTSTIPVMTISNPGPNLASVVYGITPYYSGSPCPPVNQNYVMDIYPIPVITSSLTDHRCSGVPFTYAMSSSTLGVSFHWFRPLVAGISNLPASGTSNPIDETLINTTLSPVPVHYWLKAIYSYPGITCTGDSVELEVTIYPGLTVDAGSDQVIACGTSTSLSCSVTGGTGSLYYNWQDSTLIQGSNNLPGCTTTILMPTQPTSYLYSVTVTDSEGCKNSNDVAIVVTYPCPGVFPTASPDTVCSEDQVQLYSNIVGGSGNYTFHWTSDAGFNSYLQNPVDNPVCNSIYPCLPCVITYTDSVFDGYTHLVGSITVIVKPRPLLTITPPNSSALCSGGSTNILLASNCPGTDFGYITVSGDPDISGYSSGTANPIIQLLTNNGLMRGVVNYQISLSYSGCAGTSQNYPVTVFPLPVVDAGADASIPAGSTTTLHATVSVGVDSMSYSWTPLASIASGWNTLDPTTTPMLDTTMFIIQVTDSATCVNTDTVVISIMPYPQVFNVIGGGAFCAGDSGVVVGVSYSETGISYQRKRNNILYGGILPGINGLLYFPPTADPGIYTVIATNNFNHFTKMMNGQVTVTENPLPIPYLLTPEGDSCAGTTLELSGSQAFVRYYLIHGMPPDTIDTIRSVKGTGLPGYLSLGPVTDTGIYRVVGKDTITGCFGMMYGSVSITPNPLVFYVEPQGVLCEGTTICLSGSQTGINYYLFSGLYCVDTVPGTGDTICFKPELPSGIYYVIGINPTTNCNSAMNGEDTVYARPGLYSLLPTGHHCPPVELCLTGSDTGVTYTVYHGTVPADTTQVGTPVAGTGSSICFDTVTLAGYYIVKARNNFSHCTRWMTDTLWIDPLPALFNLVSSGEFCIPKILGISGSQTGKTYYLVDTTTGNYTSRPGTGSSFFFPQLSQPGIYRIKAEDDLLPTHCTRWMNGIATLLYNPHQFAVNPPGIHCEGTQIYLAGSDTSCKYLLYRRVGAVKTRVDSLNGNGGYLYFTYSTIEGIYTVEGVMLNSPFCEAEMIDSTQISHNPLQETVTSTGHCAPVTISLPASEAMMSYELWFEPGTGAQTWLETKAGGGPITFTPVNDAGFYLVRAGYPSTPNCYRWMSDTIRIWSKPNIYSVMPTSVQCAGINVYLSFSQDSTYSYTLYLDNSVPLKTLPGTNSQLDFGPQSSTGTYTVWVDTTHFHCKTRMNDSIVMVSAPLAHQVIPAAPVCEPHLVGVDGSESQVTYYLYRSGILAPVQVKPGTGSQFYFDTQEIAGSYTVKGVYSNPGKDCEKWMTGVVEIDSLPTIHAGPDQTVCPGYSVSLSATAHNYDTTAATITWTDDPPGSGTFLPVHGLNTTYTPFGGSGLINLIISVTGTKACFNSVKTDTAGLTIVPFPAINAGPDDSICASIVTTNGYYQLAAQATGYTVFSWGTTGDGTFSDNTLL